VPRLHASSRRSSLLSCLLAAASLALAGCGDDNPGQHSTPDAGRDAGPDAGPVELRILAFNDFHGNLQVGGNIPDPDGGTVLSGGASYFATTLEGLRAPNTITVAAGDLIGASPLISALFHDEPTILLMNQIGLDLASVGNHEFDEGSSELLRMQYGGCHPIDGCYVVDGGTPGFPGASFRYLSANVFTRPDAGQTLLTPWAIKEVGGVKVGFIGMTLEGTPSIVTPLGVGGLTFTSEVSTANALVPVVKAAGAQVIAVVVHQGGVPAPGKINDCGVPANDPITTISQGLDPAIDLVISGHTHFAYVCPDLGGSGKLVTQASSFGRVITRIDLVYDPNQKKVTTKSAYNHVVYRNVAENGAAKALVDAYNVIAAPLASRVVGKASATITRTALSSGESPLGDLIADAQLAATAPAGLGGAQIAFMNPGGIRADLPPTPAGLPSLTYGDAFTVQPFGNSLVTLTLTGDEIRQALEQQWSGANATAVKILQVSAGFTYAYSDSAPAGSKVVAGSIALNGTPVDLAGTYRVTVNSFLATGGDNFLAFNQGTMRLGGAVDLDGLVAFIEPSISGAAIPPPPANRITKLQ
jgi:5'-nucleotidase